MTYDNGPICPHCGGQTHYYDKAKRIVTSAHGYFTVTPYSDDEIAVDEGFYSVKVSLPKDVNLVNKGRIILHNSNSHK